jgi:hypothetical protein
MISKKAMMAYLRYYTVIRLDGISKTTKILRHDDQLRFDSNRSLHKYRYTNILCPWLSSLQPSHCSGGYY